MTEKPDQTARADEGTTETDSGTNQVRERDQLASPFDNWRKRGHIRAEPETLLARAGTGENEQSNDGD
jgi:hypothetical protein